MTVKALVTFLLKAVFDGKLSMNAPVNTADSLPVTAIIEDGEVYITDDDDDWYESESPR